MTVEMIVAKMAEMSQEFADTGVFNRKLALDAQTALGQPHNFSKIKRASAQIGRGTYKFDASVKPTQSNQGKIKMAKKPSVPELTLVKPVAQASEELSRSGPPVNRQHFAVVPPVDPDYVPFGAYKELERLVKSRLFFPVFITGHSGNGKSSQVVQIHAKNNLPLMRLSITKQSDKDELIGCKTLQDGNIVVQEGPVLTAMRNGVTLLLEEIDTADAGVIMALQGILEGKPYYFAQSGEYVYPQPGFNIIATANTKGKGSDDGRYMGTNVLNDAFLERFGETYEQEFPPPAVEKRMVMNWMQRHGSVDETFAEELVKWADAIRRTFADGATDELISSRRLEHIVKSYAIFQNKKRCIERCTARFDDLTANAFRALFDKICSEESSPVAEVPANAAV